MNNSKKILLFQIKKEKQSHIKTLCDKLDIQTISVAPAEYNCTLGQLAGVTPRVPRNTARQTSAPLLPGMGIPQMELLVFSGISSELLDTFLAEYKQAGIEPVPLKAVVTPSNIQWDVTALYRELLREHLQLPH